MVASASRHAGVHQEPSLLLSPSRRPPAPAHLPSEGEAHGWEASARYSSMSIEFYCFCPQCLPAARLGRDFAQQCRRPEGGTCRSLNPGCPPRPRGAAHRHMRPAPDTARAGPAARAERLNDVREGSCGFACPQCGATNQIDILAKVWVCLRPDGSTDPDLDSLEHEARTRPLSLPWWICRRHPQPSFAYRTSLGQGEPVGQTLRGRQRPSEPWPGEGAAHDLPRLPASQAGVSRGR